MKAQGFPLATPASLSPEQKAEWQARRTARRAERQARKADRASMARAIRAKFDEGLTSEEIGEALGLSPRRVRRLAIAFDIGRLTPHQRHFGFKCSARTARRVQQLAEGAGVPVGEMIDRIVGTVVGEGLDHAKRKLGRLALPKTARTARRASQPNPT